jgi:hypothetical protein
MALGILDTLGLVGTLIFALPLALLGLQFLAGERQLLGAGLVVVAALMVLLPRFITTPGDVPGAVASRLVGTAVTEPEADGNEDGDAE